MAYCPRPFSSDTNERAYISQTEAESMRTYRYPGTDDRSLWYNYVLDPLAARAVAAMPRWLAPNTITVAGMGLVAASSAIMGYHLPDFEGVAPRWVYAALSLSILAYQLLDVCDGKQARKTGNGSPLGLLFDHGCDALNVVVGGSAIATSLQLGPTWQSIALMMSAMSTFFFATFEEYFTGTLHLPVINGPNEGLLTVALIHLANAFVGPDFWLGASPLFGLRRNHAFLLVTVAGTAINVCMNVCAVRAHVRGQGGSTLRAVATCWPFVGLLLCVACWLRWSPLDAALRHHWLLLWGAGLASCKLVTHIMLSHLCATDFRLMRKTLVPIFLCACLCPLAAALPSWPRLPEGLLLQLLMALVLVSYCHMVYNVICEATAILNIKCFRVKPVKP